MGTYLWNNLSAPDFERFGRDALRHATGLDLGTFSTGTDRGIDMRRCATPDGVAIGQAKHRPGLAGGTFVTDFIRTELPKVSKLKPGRFLIATSANLLPQHENDLVTAFSPWLKSGDDVFGVDKLESALRDNEGLLLDHVKLWLPSSGPLIQIINAASRNYTSTHVEIARNKLACFVQRPSLATARQVLDKHRCVVLAGPAGTGKTMLADVLLLESIDQGFAPTVAAGSLDDLFQAWSSGDDPQVFFYDDFLGQISSAEKVLGSEDRRLVEFMHLVDRSPHRRRLIMTARSYMVDEARRRFDALRDGALDPLKVVVDAGELTLPDRALILYNHAHAQEGLDPSDLASLVPREGWKPIVTHQNYQPRLVQFSTDRFARQRPGLGLAQFIKHSLDHPDDIWETFFHKHMPSHGRSLFWGIFSLPRPARSRDVFAAAAAFEGDNSVDSEQQLANLVRQLEGSELQVTDMRVMPGSLIDFVNPSIRDYLAMLAGQSQSLFRTLLDRCCYFEQLVPMLSQLGIAIGGTSVAHVRQLTMVHATGIGKAIEPETVEAIRRNLLRLLTSPKAQSFSADTSWANSPRDHRPIMSTTTDLRLRAALNIASSVGCDPSGFVEAAAPPLSAEWRRGEVVHGAAAFLLGQHGTMQANDRAALSRCIEDLVVGLLDGRHFRDLMLLGEAEKTGAVIGDADELRDMAEARCWDILGELEDGMDMDEYNDIRWAVEDVATRYGLDWYEMEIHLDGITAVDGDFTPDDHDRRSYEAPLVASPRDPLDDIDDMMATLTEGR